MEPGEVSAVCIRVIDGAVVYGRGAHQAVGQADWGIVQDLAVWRYAGVRKYGEMSGPLDRPVPAWGGREPVRFVLGVLRLRD